ncbi:MAG: TlpA family protein disulfide reductase [Candidatus Omnitrophica bacterium]|nr:TlpA family protein disulfide reductase [Candidatus Omnitrophota bacterium]
MRRSIVFTLALVVLLVASLGCEGQSAEVTRSGAPHREKAPDFTLAGLKGGDVKLSSLTGEGVVLLDFTTTWCPHCVTIIPALKEIHANYKDVKVVAVYINESKANVEKFAKKHDLPYLVLLDSGGSVATQYKVRGVPTVVAIGKDGLIRFTGHHISKEEIDRILKEG